MNIKTYIGFDVGRKRTGVAIANSLTNTAKGLDTIYHHKDGRTNWGDIDKLVNKYQANKFIIGLPLKSDGSEQEMTYIAKSFARKLERKFKIETILVDEFLSTNEAKSQLKYNHFHKNSKRMKIDKLAAAIILQTWLNNPT